MNYPQKAQKQLICVARDSLRLCTSESIATLTMIQPNKVSDMVLANPAKEDVITQSIVHLTV